MRHKTEDFHNKGSSDASNSEAKIANQNVLLPEDQYMELLKRMLCEISIPELVEMLNTGFYCQINEFGVTPNEAWNFLRLNHYLICFHEIRLKEAIQIQKEASHA